MNGIVITCPLVKSSEMVNANCCRSCCQSYKGPYLVYYITGYLITHCLKIYHDGIPHFCWIACTHPKHWQAFKAFEMTFLWLIWEYLYQCLLLSQLVPIVNLTYLVRWEMLLPCILHLPKRIVCLDFIMAGSRKLKAGWVEKGSMVKDTAPW